MRRLPLGLRILCFGLATLGGACFSPKQPACAFSCAVDGLCPASYACGADGLCHRADGVGVCLLAPGDGAADDGDADDGDADDGDDGAQ